MNKLLFSILIVSVAVRIDACASAAALRPNVVMILADDLGYGDVHCFNPERGRIPTPNIDRLAAQGMRFSDGHSSSGVCSPSRYALLTGRYHWRSRLQFGIVGVFGAPLIAPDRLTIAGLARQHGYRTACVGKWHLGWDWPMNDGQRKLMSAPKDQPAVVTAAHRQAWHDVFSRRIAGGPTTRGFDVYFGTDVPNWPPYCFIDNDRTIGIPSAFLPESLFKINQASTQGPAVPDWKFEPILPELAERAAQFISGCSEKKEPFLLYLPLTSPHTPLAVNAAWKGRSKLNAYADFVMETDAAVGRVLAALDQSGAADNTLLIFTADNGCAPYIGVKELERHGHFPSGPLRGFKSDVWEGGHRVPFLARWPGIVPAGTVCPQLVHQTDLLATFADVLGVKLPETAGEDSFSLLPLLRGDDKPVRETAVSCSSNGVPGLRLGNWKFIPDPGSGGWSSGGDQTQPVQLFNLAEDISESKNLAAAMPEKVSELKALLEKLIVDGRSTPGAVQANDVAVLRYPRPVAAKKTSVGN